MGHDDAKLDINARPIQLKLMRRSIIWLLTPVILKKTTPDVIRFQKQYKCHKFSRKIGYPISSDLPTHLYPILSDFREPTYPPNYRISYVDGP